MQNEYSDFIGFMFSGYERDSKQKSYADELFREGKSKLLKNTVDFMLASPTLQSMVDALHTDEVMKVVFSTEAMGKLQRGIYDFQNQNDDLLMAVAVDGNGTIRELGKIDLEQIGGDANLNMLMMSMQGMAIQSQLDDILLTMREIVEGLNTVVIGQYNNRLVHYRAAEAMHRESERIASLELKCDLQVETLTSLTTAISEQELALKTDLDFIVYSYDMRKNVFAKERKTQETIQRISDAYSAIHRAYHLKTAIYFNEGEYKAAIGTLIEYKQLLLSTIADDKVYEALYYADGSQKLKNGAWHQRSRELPAKIDRLIGQAKNPSQYYIAYKKKEC